MSFSDKAPGAAPEPGHEPGPDAEDSWTEADSTAVDAEAEVEAAAPEEPAAPADPIAVLTAERDEYLLALQRSQADFENYRKRVTRLQDEQSARASGDLVAKLLPVLDTLDLAQAHQGEGADSEDAKVLNASRSMLLDVLAKAGLERVDAAEVPFDPAVHDAVARAEGDDTEVVIDEVLRSGYRWKGQVLRPAMVRVRG
jgi:molecular chaperone GrpE